MKIKKTAIISIAVVLVLGIGGLTAFAANARKGTLPQETAMNSGTTTAGTQQAVENDQTLTVQEQAQLEKENKETNATKYAIYEKYGLTYDKEKDCFFFDGKQVRYFKDTIDVEGNINGFSYGSGDVDLKASRNLNYELTGIEPYSQSDFDARTKTMQENLSDSKLQSNGSYEGGNPNWVDDSLDAYSKLGVSYDKSTSMWYYQKQSIHVLYDENVLTFADTNSTGLNLKVVRNASGAIEKLAEMTASEVSTLIN